MEEGLSGIQPLESRALCPLCSGALRWEKSGIICASCDHRFSFLGEIPILLPDGDRYLATCRQQLFEMATDVDRVTTELRAAGARSGAIPATRDRCDGLADALKAQLRGIEKLLRPVVGSGGRVDKAIHRDHLSFDLEYLPYAFRDWGWEPEDGDENALALHGVISMLGEGHPGDTLILGAGACRLAYDLHKRYPEARFVVLDWDPLLFSVARAVTQGEVVDFWEANLEVGSLSQVARKWELKAPLGPVDEDRFQFLVGDATNPPFPSGTFDTVVTPWFIDQGPSDLRALVSVICRVLRDGGRWANLGPLRYEPSVSMGLRFGKEEILDLLGRAHFRVEKSDETSLPYLVSKLNGRGKIEWVFSFSAVKGTATASPDRKRHGPAPWLLFGHLPVPTFDGQGFFRSESPTVNRLVAAIDGRRTLHDLARLLTSERLPPGMSLEEVREGVRELLHSIHPEAHSE